MNDKVIAVTGAFGVLGKAVVEVLAAAGARVAAIDISQEEVPGAAALVIGGIDGAEPGSAETAVAQVVGSLGRLDGLVNIAGGFAWETVQDGRVESWDRMYRINLRTALVMSKAAIPALTVTGGAMVNVGAAAAAKAAPGMGPYAASKAGVARLTEALAEELKDKGIRVNAVLPTIIDTPTNREDMPDAEFHRWVRPAQLANVVRFLLSEEAAAVTGALVPVSGRV